MKVKKNYKKIIEFGINDLYLKIEKDNHKKEKQHKNEIEKENLKHNSEKEALQSTILKMSNNNYNFLNIILIIVLIFMYCYFYFINNKFI